MPLRLQPSSSRGTAFSASFEGPKKWVEEGFDLAKREVYTFGPETGSREHPLPLPAGYEENARRVARVQLAKAGFRLAAALNAKLGH